MGEAKRRQKKAATFVREQFKLAAKNTEELLKETNENLERILVHAYRGRNSGIDKHAAHIVQEQGQPAFDKWKDGADPFESCHS
jgi:hypothetical protein